MIERILNASVEQVWEAITDNKKMKQWYFDIETFRPDLGFEFRFSGGDENKQYLHLCKITEVIPGRKLSYAWRYEKETGESLVTFELFPEGDKTKLRLTHAGLETFPANDPGFAKESFAKGWEFILGISLKNFLEEESKTKN
jgi:uncharacterized protein YndB with AHSA1/START domain